MFGENPHRNSNKTSLHNQCIVKIFENVALIIKFGPLPVWEAKINKQITSEKL